jgi:parvulin-like peptidyl-prolyl isomerase
MQRTSLAVAVIFAACAALVLACMLAGCSERKQAETSQAPQGGQTQQASQAPAGGQAAEPPKTVQPAPPGTIRASHILLAYQGSGVEGVTRTKEEARKSIDEILARIKKGESFEDLASTYSDCPSAEQGGDLGFFGKGRMVPPFDQAAFALGKGQISGVVETQFGYHIIKRTQ